ncbi:MAG: F0F1 ATP synthase subunit delta [Woeseia sp.]|nr:F0F1 ATP synthase subunit delta [Woeseia sp.]|tara:strand:+ start:729 stop:1292 length:564 start_codon:yes stop_codon:yes gene_type:complete
MADNNTIARPYAQAIFEFAQETDALDELSISLTAAKDILADGRVIKALNNPALERAEKLNFLTDLFIAAIGPESFFSGTNDHGTNFLKLLLEYSRLDVLPEIRDRVEVLKSDAENRIEVNIKSATELSDSQIREIQSALKTRLGREINLSTEMDKNLLGGAVIRAGDIVIDGSVRAKLESLANTLIS